MRTTAGQLIVNDALPDWLQDHAKTLTADETEKLLGALARRDPDSYREISHKLTEIGRNAAFDESATLSLSDMQPNVDRTALFAHARQQTARIQNDKELTPAQKQVAIAGVYGTIQKAITDENYATGRANENPFALQVLAKARGTPGVLAALQASPGSYTDPQGNIIPVFVSRSFAEGLRPHEYWAGSFGARQGVVSTKFCLHEDTPVLLQDYTAKAIKDLQPGDAVWTVDADDRLLGTKVSAVCRTGVKPCYDWEFGPGKRSKSVVATAEHTLYMQYRTRGGDHALSKVLAPLDYATRGRRSAILPKPRLDGVREPRAFILGALIGDGGISGHNTNIFISDPRLRDYLLKTLPEFNMTLGCPTDMPGCTRYLVTEIVRSGAGSGVKTPFRAWLAELGLLGHKAPTKFIPEAVYTWDVQSVVEFIAGLIATDGAASLATNQYGLKYPTLTYASSSPRLISDLKRLLATRLFLTTSFGEVCYCAGEHSEIYGRTTNRNHNMHSVLVSDYTSQALLLPYIPVDAATKFERWAGMMNSARRRKPNMTTRFKHRSDVQYAETVDIEVEHHSHMFVLANGLIVGNSTRDAGDLGKQFNQASMRTVVTADDCGTLSGIPVKANDRENIGAELAQVAGKYPAGTVVTKEIMSDLSKTGDADEIVVRSPMSCSQAEGVCKHCVGLREDGNYPKLGDHVGITASSALAERIAQGSLNVKHSGGMTSAGGKKQDLAGFDIINQLFQVPKQFAHSAAVASLDGEVERITPAPQGGTLVYVNGQAHHVLPENEASVQVGDKVEAGDQISDGLLNPRDVLEHKGVGEARRYLAERATKAFRDSGYAVHRRNMELLVRGVINHAELDDDSGPYMMGDVVDYSSLAATYKPREDSKTLDINASIGQYLEQPVLHHTIGTRITDRMAKQLARHGHSQVTANVAPPPFRPRSFGLRAVPQQEKDWMAQLGSSHLTKNLLKNVHRGAESNLRGLHPVPAMAKSIDIGRFVPEGIETQEKRIL